MRVANYEQGTEEWLAWRRQGIGASEIGTIMGDNPYETLTQIWEFKIGLRPPKTQSAAMIRGHRLEPAIRRVYETAIAGADFKPFCAEHDTLPWIMASLDGLSQSQTRVLEIKATSSMTVWLENSFGLVTYYWWQCQQQLLVTDAEQVDLLCWMPDSEDGPPLLFHIRPNPDAQMRLVRQSVEFMKAVRDRRPPVAVVPGMGGKNVDVPRTVLPERDWWKVLQQFLPTCKEDGVVEGFE
jgi:putative phage-type endonuclease